MSVIVSACVPFWYTSSLLPGDNDHRRRLRCHICCSSGVCSEAKLQIPKQSKAEEVSQEHCHVRDLWNNKESVLFHQMSHVSASQEKCLRFVVVADVREVGG